MIRRITLVLMLAGTASVWAQSDARDQSPARAEWISNTLAKLRVFTVTPETPKAEQKFLGQHPSYGVPGNEGNALLTFGSNQWLYVITHSDHIPVKIGDISLAVDQDGTIYSGEQHVCGGIRFIDTNSASFAISTADFISRFIAWPDEPRTSQWRIVERKEEAPNRLQRTSLRGGAEP